MNYLELINQFWQKDIEYDFSDREVALYFYLLKVSNSICWKNPFGLSNSMTIAKFGWGKTSFNTAKNNLKLAGLIDFKTGDGRGNVCRYEIKGVQKVPLSVHLSDTLSDTLSDLKPATSLNSKNKQNEKEEEAAPPEPVPPKEQKKEKEKLFSAPAEISYPFTSDQFRVSWDEWKEYRKEIKKPFKSPKSEQKALKLLAKLADGNEGCAIQAIDYSIAQGYQGLFPPKNYQNGSKRSTPESRIGRATLFDKP